MEFREATVWDAYKITDMWVEMMDEIKIPGRNCGEQEKEVYFLTILTAIKDKWKSVVVVDNGDLVGFITAKLQYYDLAPGKLIGICDNIFIKKEYRGKGLKDRLLDWITVWGKMTGMMEMEFQTIYDEKLIKLWGRKGFKPVQITFMKEVNYG